MHTVYPSITLPNGHRLFWRDISEGKRTYYSEETSGGIRVWDTHYVDMSTLLAAIEQEIHLGVHKDKDEWKEIIKQLSHLKHEMEKCKKHESKTDHDTGI